MYNFSVADDVPNITDLENYALESDFPKIPTQVSLAVKQKKYQNALNYCNNLPTGGSHIYKFKGFVNNKSILGAPWKLPTFDEILIAFLIDKSITTGEQGSRYYWTDTSDKSQFARGDKTNTKSKNAHLVIRPTDRNWYFSDTEYPYDVRCIR